MHPGQFSITLAQASALIREQFPQWNHAEITPVASTGTVCALFRIGAGLIARFPIMPIAPEDSHLEAERQLAATGELARARIIASPQPVGLGRPGHGYPLWWTILTWVEGTPASEADISRSVPAARDLAKAIAAMRKIPTAGRTFEGSGRGGLLTDHDAWVERCLAESRGLDLPLDSLRGLWRDLRTTPRRGSDVMGHRDLVPGNVLTAGIRIVGLIDVGQFGPADPALDLVGAWHLFEQAGREAIRDHLGTEDEEWARGRAWALAQALGGPWYYRHSNPAQAAMSMATLARVLEGP